MVEGALDLPPEGLLLPGVVLVGDPARGTVTTDGLNLLFTSAGITVQGQAPERLHPWGQVDTATCHDQTLLTDGRTAIVLVLTSGGQVIQFLLPPECATPGQAAYLDLAMPAWVVTYRCAAPTPAGPEVAAAPPPPIVEPTPPPPATAETAPVLPTDVSPPTAAEPPPPAAAAAPEPPPATAPPAETPTTPPAPVEGGGAAQPTTSTNRRLVGLVVVLLVVVIGLVVYLVVSRNDSSTGNGAGAAVSPVAADQALAVSINLHTRDLPTGWTVGPRATSSRADPAAPTAAAATGSQAVSSFAACLGMPAAAIGQLFGDIPQADVGASAASPTFLSPTDTAVQMRSTTNVVQTAADGLDDALPFTRWNFGACFQNYSTANAAESDPGATAQVATLTLPAPTGVLAYGYLTTLTLPNRGTRVIGDVFIIGGRVETTLSPSTSGPPVPLLAFVQAYQAVVARVAAATGQ
jgi:hypothetical protein